MSAYKLEEVIRKWELEQLTIEQAIGQILMLIRERDQRLQELEDRVSSLRQALNGPSKRPPDPDSKT
jgi:exonuclease VII small subunit